ncbi:MAG: paraquat-inducible protein A [Pseudomonadota bacterium]|nr:paraquat-inducible protein A [Pseudomonadota bacterium]
MHSPLSICEDCDAVFERRALARGEAAFCARCGCELYRGRHVNLDSMLAVTVASLILFALMNILPVVFIKFGKTVASPTVWDAILASYDAGIGLVAVIVAVCMLGLPLVQLLLYLYVLPPLRAGRVPRHFGLAMRALRHARPWSMVEVFLVGVLVTSVKLAKDFELTIGAGLYCMAALTVMLTVLLTFTLHEIWERAEECST